MKKMASRIALLSAELLGCFSSFLAGFVPSMFTYMMHHYITIWGRIESIVGVCIDWGCNANKAAFNVGFYFGKNIGFYFTIFKNTISSKMF
jgi:hypothetical protein